MEGESAELVLRGPLTPAGLGALCRRVHQAAADGARGPLVCTVEGAADLTVVDALARGHLIARRHGRTLAVRSASPELSGLVQLVGLTDHVRPVGPGPAGPTIREGGEPSAQVPGCRGSTDPRTS